MDDSKFRITITDQKYCKDRMLVELYEDDLLKLHKEIEALLNTFGAPHDNYKLDSVCNSCNSFSSCINYITNNPEISIKCIHFGKLKENHGF